MDFQRVAVIGPGLLGGSLVRAIGSRSKESGVPEVRVWGRRAEPIEQLPHLRLHNGTIWRWNRPLLGFEADGTPHLRIEHRAMPAGPSIPDLIANAALYHGLVHALARATPSVPATLPFAMSRANFYAAAQDGLRAEIVWLNGRRASLRQLLLEELLPLARWGLRALEIDAADADEYLGIVAARVDSGRTGSDWQAPSPSWQASPRPAKPSRDGSFKSFGRVSVSATFSAMATGTMWQSWQRISFCA